ncbi:hypothetical protein SELMODRAFT_73724 [Selaginella moellendorffii]|uniref:Uncharacterized protein n=2 Tax=Selaginella moellendorffii TaxID=88036 RepID=D8QQD6_SELML|nr:hypothetical protein SELMODRAFT_73724 [Selaginella moellendorffii]
MSSSSSSSSSASAQERKFGAEKEIRLYNPYDFYGTSGGASSGAADLYRLPSAPEFLFTEEAAFQRRSLGENIQYYTGVGYLGGAVLGGAKGIFDGIRSREVDDTTKLRLNRVLNASGHTGRSIGNKVGVLGLLYAGVESGTWYLRGADDILNPVLAGLATGALYKAAAGPRTAAIAGALGGIAAGSVVAGKHIVRRYLPSL